MGKKNGSGGSLGTAIIRSKRKQRTINYGIGPVNAPAAYKDPESIATLTDSGRSGPSVSSQGADGVSKAWKNMNSITDQGDLDSFLQTAVLSERQFTAERGAVVVEPTRAFTVVQKSQDELDAERARVVLRVPRRPKWTKDMTALELERGENKAFLEWRRGLARIEQERGLTITPYEKNVEIWRQFWRVIEKSDALMQIVDARDPLFFASEDVVNYVKETGEYKKAFLLINKSDMLTLKQRIAWAMYFKKHGISFLFWSALKSQKDELEGKKQAKADLEKQKEIEKEKQLKKEMSIEDDEDEDNEEGSANDELPEEEKDLTEEERKYIKDARIRSGAELLELLFKLGRVLGVGGGRVTVGMVGYPNVGKSSTINAICGCKRVAVTSTPGKTKHFQTINLSDKLTLCDCPGLVLPSFVGSRADMVCNGVLPIDQMSDYVSPVVLVCQRIPLEFILEKYGLTQVKPPPTHGVGEYDADAPRLLRTFAAQRGFFTAHGEPDMSRAARLIMKDYVSGELFYGHPPPGVSASAYGVPGRPAGRVCPPPPPPPPKHRRQRRVAKDDKIFEYQVPHIAGARKGKKKFIVVEKTEEEKKRDRW